MRACLALLLLLLAVESRAAVGIDGANFPNGIQSHSATGVVEFGWQGVLETDNRQLRAGSIVQNTSQSPATCGSLGFCQAVAPPAPTQEPGAFPSTSGTQDVTLGYQQSGSLSGDGSNQYRRIQVGQEATLTINMTPRKKRGGVRKQEVEHQLREALGGWTWEQRVTETLERLQLR